MTFESGRSGPLLLTRFFGREAEAAELVQLVHRSRLVTLVGPPGCGKTRLSQELCGRLAEGFAAGARYVELASVTDPSLAPHAVAAALRVRDRAGSSAEEALVEELTDREVLVVLDNCEHLLTAVGDLAEHLLARCPRLHLLATSRMALGVPGEQVWQVLPLDLDPAVELFVDRARLAAGHLPTRDSRRVVERICTRLDGVPLAIELAAAWTRVLTPVQILEHLERVMALPGGRAPRGNRQQTMDATIDWSYRRLGPAEQRLFEELSVFAGGFDLAAAQVVATTGAPPPAAGDGPRDDGRSDTDGTDDSGVLAALATLVEHSLVLTAPVSGREMRYRLLEPLRQFAAARFAERADRDEVRRRHVEHYLGLATQADRDLRASEPRAVLRRLEVEEGNLRVALDYARDQDGDLGLRLCTALARSWALRGRVSEGRAWLEEMLQVETPDRELRCQALAVASRMAYRQTDYATARRLLDESLALARTLGNPQRVARRLRNLAMIALAESKYDDAESLCRESIDVFRAEGDDYGLGLALAFLGVTLQLAGRHDEGRACSQEALELSRATGNLMGVNYGHAGLIFAALATGDRRAVAELAPHRDEEVRTLRALGGLPEDPGWMWMVVGVASSAGEHEVALRLAAAVEARGQGDGVQFHEAFRRYLEPWLDRARDRIGMARSAQLALEGQALTADQLVEECVRALESIGEPSSGKPGATAGPGRVGAGGGGPDSPLSTREHEVARLIARGLANDEIAQKLFISKRTVESHVSHIKRKLGLTRRSQIVAWVTRQ